MGDDLYEHVRNNAANEFDKLLESNNKHLGYKFNGTYLEFVRAVYDAAALVLNVDTRHDHYDIQPDDNRGDDINLPPIHGHVIHDRGSRNNDYAAADDVDVAVYDLVRRDDIDNLRASLDAGHDRNVIYNARRLVDNVKPAGNVNELNDAAQKLIDEHDIWALRAAYIDAHANHAAVSNYEPEFGAARDALIAALAAAHRGR